MATYGWITDANADIYFSTRLDASTYWASGTDKVGALTTAYNRLNRSKKFNLTGATQALLEEAQCEQALFMLQQGIGLDQRMGVQAQNVLEAGVVKEKYRNDSVGIVIAPIVMEILEAYVTNTLDNAFATDLKRDDSEDVL